MKQLVITRTKCSFAYKSNTFISLYNQNIFAFDLSCSEILLFLSLILITQSNFCCIDIFYIDCASFIKSFCYKNIVSIF